MTQRTCDIGGCDRAHLARGLCSSHYGSWHRRTHGRKRNAEPFEITCVACGETHMSARPDGKYCSELCYHYDRWGPRVCRWPKPERRKAKVKPAPAIRRSPCEWCGTEFDTSRASQRMCSKDCKTKAAHVRRRGRAAGSTSHFTWAEGSGT